EADALINLCGATKLRDEHMACPARLLVDTDPVYEQIKYAKADSAARAYVDAHTHLFTYGENLGAADCSVPLSGKRWIATRPPVVLSEWPMAAGEPPCFRSITTRENKGNNIDYGGETYLWSKHQNFVRFLDLPRDAPEHCFSLALMTVESAVRDRVAGHGWRVVDPRPISADMTSY